MFVQHSLHFPALSHHMMTYHTHPSHVPYEIVFRTSLIDQLACSKATVFFSCPSFWSNVNHSSQSTGRSQGNTTGRSQGNTTVRSQGNTTGRSQGNTTGRSQGNITGRSQGNTDQQLSNGQVCRVSGVHSRSQHEPFVSEYVACCWKLSDQISCLNIKMN